MTKHGFEASRVALVSLLVQYARGVLVERLFDMVHKATAKQGEDEQDRVDEEYSAVEAEPRLTSVKPHAWSEIELELLD